MELKSQDDITQDIIESGCVSWEDLVRSVRNFGYGRNENREDFNLVWRERKGTCSSKHAFLYQIAQKNEIPNVELLLGIYLMTVENTPKIDEVLKQFELKGIPEAHCYLKIGNDYLDATTVRSDYQSFSNQLMVEKPIAPNYVISEKVKEHKEFLQNWISENNIPYSESELWEIREKCIGALSGH